MLITKGGGMAEKRPSKKAKSEPLPHRISVKIQPDAKPDTPSYYINYAAVDTFRV